MEVWSHDRWGIPLPAGHKFPISKYTAAARAGLGLGHGARERARAVGVAGRRARRRSARAHPHRDPVAARGARARAAVVGGAGGARAALGRRDAGRGAAGAGARHRHEPRRRHPPRGARLRPRLLPVQRRRGDRRAAARRGPGPDACWWSTATSTRATARPRSSAPTQTRSRSRCTEPATIRSSAFRATSTSICRPGRPTRPYIEALSEALDVAIASPGHRVLPRGRRSVGGRPPRPARADEARPARPRRARSAPPAGNSDGRRARRRLRAGHQRTPSTSTPPPSKRSSP